MPANLARLLVESGVITQSVADECLRRHLAVGGALDTVLLEAGACSEGLLLSYLAQAADVQPATAGVFQGPDPKILAVFPFKLADRHTMVPIEMGKRHMDVAAAYPIEKLLLEELSFMLGKDLRPRVAIEARLREAIARLYDKPLPSRYAQLCKKLGAAPMSLELPSLDGSRAAANARPPTPMALGRAQAGTVAVWPPPSGTSEAVARAPESARPPTAPPGAFVVAAWPPPASAQSSTPTAPAISSWPPAQTVAVEAAPVNVVAAPEATARPPSVEVDAAKLLGLDAAPGAPSAAVRPPSGELDAAALLGFDELPAGPSPVLEGAAMAEAETVEEEDASQLLPPDPPVEAAPPEPAPKPVEYEIRVELDTPPATEPEPEAAAAQPEEPVRVEEEPAAEPVRPPPLPKRPRLEIVAEPEPAPEPVAAAAEPEPQPLEVMPAPAPQPPASTPFEIEELPTPNAPVPPVPPMLDAPLPDEVRPELMGAPSSDSRPQSRGVLEARKLLSSWHPADDGLDALGDALAGVLEGIDPSAFAPEPVPDLPAIPPSMALAAPAAATAMATGEVQHPPANTWTLSQARARLHAAPARDEIIDVALQFALKSFDFAAALAVRSGTAFGWTALGNDGADHEEVHRVALPLDAPSVLRTVLRARGRYLGPLPEDDLTVALLHDLGRERPLVALIYPVFVRERPVAIFYADRARRHVAAPRVAEFLLFAQELSTSFERAIILHKKARTEAAELPPAAQAPLEVAPAPAAPIDAPAPTTDDDDLFPITEEAPVYEPRVRSLEELFADLLGIDRKKRLAAMADLEARPDEAAPALAAQFPGPTAMRRGLVVDLPEAEELGPVLAALARCKAYAAPFIDRLVREGDPDQRFFAVLVAGSLKRPELFGALQQALFDPVVEVAAAARAAAGAMRGLPGFEDGVATHLRKQLASTDPERVAAAALAIGRTRDIAAIPLLIPLTGHAEDRVAAEAGEALTQITKQTHGDSPRRWQAWWEQNRARPRIAWLVEGLAHKDVQVRLSSIEELVELSGDALGYLADGSRKDREKSLERWDAWLEQHLR